MNNPDGTSGLSAVPAGHSNWTQGNVFDVTEQKLLPTKTASFLETHNKAMHSSHVPVSQTNAVL